MKIGKKKLKMSSGEVRTFDSESKRDNFERVAQAYKHGWRPKENPTSAAREANRRAVNAKKGIK